MCTPCSNELTLFGEFLCEASHGALYGSSVGMGMGLFMAGQGTILDQSLDNNSWTGWFLGKKDLMNYQKGKEIVLLSGALGGLVGAVTQLADWLTRSKESFGSYQPCRFIYGAGFGFGGGAFLSITSIVLGKKIENSKASYVLNSNKITQTFAIRLTTAASVLGGVAAELLLVVDQVAQASIQFFFSKKESLSLQK